MEHLPIWRCDVFPIEHGDIPASPVSLPYGNRYHPPLPPIKTFAAEARPLTKKSLKENQESKQFRVPMWCRCCLTLMFWLCLHIFIYADIYIIIFMYENIWYDTYIYNIKLEPLEKISAFFECTEIINRRNGHLSVCLWIIVNTVVHLEENSGPPLAWIIRCIAQFDAYITFTQYHVAAACLLLACHYLPIYHTVSVVVYTKGIRNRVSSVQKLRLVGL